MMLSSPISFPNLGIEINPSRVAFSIGSKDIYWYGIIIAIGFALAVLYACRRAPQFGLTEDHILDMLLCAVPAAIICARLYYCIFYWELYAENPVSVLYIWEGGLAIYGGVIGAVLAVWIYSRIKKVKLGPMLDIGGLGLLIGQMIGRWGNFINREAYGSVTNSFLKMGLTDAAGAVTYYHPTFLYESAWNLMGFLILHFYSKKHRHYDGEIFTLYIVWYGLGRGMIEGLRTDSLYLFGTGFRVSQLLAILSCLVAVALLVWNLFVHPHDPEEMLVNQVKRKTEDAVSAALAEEDLEHGTKSDVKSSDQAEQEK